MKSNDLRAMAPPAARAGYGLGWIALQGGVCAAIAFGAYYAFSTPNLLPGSGPRESLAHQTLAAVSRVTSSAPAPAAAVPRAPPAPTPAQEAAASVLAFIARTPPTDPVFADCAARIRTPATTLIQKFGQGDHEAIARVSECYLVINPARLCEAAPRRAMLNLLTVYFATRRAHIAAERSQPGAPVLAAARWDTPLDRNVRAKFRATLADGVVVRDEIAAFRDPDMQALARDPGEGQPVCAPPPSPRSLPPPPPPVAGFTGMNPAIPAAGAAAAALIVATQPALSGPAVTKPAVTKPALTATRPVASKSRPVRKPVKKAKPKRKRK